MAAYMRNNLLTTCIKLHCAFGSSKYRLYNSVVHKHEMYYLIARGYVRGVRRTPIKVYKPDELSDVHDAKNTREKAQQQYSEDPMQHLRPTPTINTGKGRTDHDLEHSGKKHSSRIDHSSSQHSDTEGPVDVHHVETETKSSIITDNQNQRIDFEKAFADDKRLGQVMTLLKSRKTRQKTGKLILEGRRLLMDALHAGAEAETIFFDRVETVKELPLHLTNAKLVKVPSREIRTWSDLVTPYGVIGIFKQPKYTFHDTQADKERLPLTLICDNIRDPGNMGTILRSAVAVQCDKILVTKGCVDIWESKVLRAGAGAHFHMPILNNLTWHDVTNFVEQSESTCYIADNNALSKGAQDTRDSNSDSSTESDEPESDGDTIIPHHCAYYQIDWRGESHRSLVIGGETHGVSTQAYKLCADTDGCGIFIPMSRSVESLNNAMAASIILFEVQRQVEMGDM